MAALWASPPAVPAHGATGDAGNNTHPFPSLLKSGLSSHGSFGSPFVFPCPLSGADICMTLCTRGAHTGPKVYSLHQTSNSILQLNPFHLCCSLQ